MRRLLVRVCGWLAAALGVVMLAACGGTTATAPAPLRVVATEFRFEPATLTIQAGQPATLTLKNAGQTLHDITIQAGPDRAATGGHADGDHLNSDDPYHIAASAGQEATLPVTLPAGSYSFVCSVSGHEQLGMKGTLVVEEKARVDR